MMEIVHSYRLAHAYFLDGVIIIYSSCPKAILLVEDFHVRIFIRDYLDESDTDRLVTSNGQFPDVPTFAFYLLSL